MSGLGQICLDFFAASSLLHVNHTIRKSEAIVETNALAAANANRNRHLG